MKNSSASSKVLTGDHQTGSQHKRGHEPLFDAYIFYVTVGTYITALSKLFLTLSRCVGSNLVSKLQGPREARIVVILILSMNGDRPGKASFSQGL